MQQRGGIKISKGRAGLKSISKNHIVSLRQIYSKLPILLYYFSFTFFVFLVVKFGE